MTREEAIEILKADNIVGYSVEDILNARDMAIKALEQESSYNSVNSLVESKLKNPKAKTFDILHFVADNAGLSTFEAIEKAYNIGLSEQEPCEDGMEKHTDRQIYDGCIHLMQKMVDYFKEYLEYLGYDLDKLDEDDRFAVGISNMEIVRRLFLSHTRNSGGCSTRDFCGKIGLDETERVKFEFERDEECQN